MSIFYRDVLYYGLGDGILHGFFLYYVPNLGMCEILSNIKLMFDITVGCWVSSVEWLSPTSIMYGKNIGFIREVTH
jgi:hypothetical protein